MVHGNRSPKGLLFSYSETEIPHSQVRYFLVLSVILCLEFCDIRQISVIAVIVETVAYNEIIRNAEK